MRNPLLVLAGQHLAHHPIRTLLTVLGIAVGVSAPMAIRIANVEVFRAFEDSVTEVVGEATVQVSGGDMGVDERLITSIRHHPAVRSASPIIRESAVIFDETHQGKPVMIWGMDLVEMVGALDVQVPQDNDGTLPFDHLLAPNAVFFGKDLMGEWGLTVGESLSLLIGSQIYEVVVGGAIESGTRGRRWESLAVMDVAAAQAVFGLVGRLDQIDIVTYPGASVDQVIRELRDSLGPAVKVSRPSQRNQQVERMLRVFQLNLLTLSTVGLLVGVFLAYNTVAFTVVQYRREIGILRALGMLRSQVSTLFLGEAAVVGLLGGLVGTGVGMVLASFLVSLESESVSELYAAVTVSTLRIPPYSFVWGPVLGMMVAMVGAAGPCWEAGATSPARALAPGDYENERQMRNGRFAWMSVTMFAIAGVLMLQGPIDGIPVFGYASAFCLLLGCTFLGPLSLLLLKGMIRMPWMSRTGLVVRLAADQVIRAPGRSSVTLSALMVGIAIMIGVGIMVRSFRDTVEVWIDQTMMADLIVAPHSWLHDADEGVLANRLPLTMVAEARSLHGVAAVDPYRQIRVEVGPHEITLVARDFQTHAARSRYLFVSGDSSKILQRSILEEGVIVSEVLSETLEVREGDRIKLPTVAGWRSFPVMGVFYDYATDGGKVVMDHSLYQHIWEDPSATVLALYLEPGAKMETVRAELQRVLGPKRLVYIISNRELRAEILEIFDRTFRVTYGLELIAVFVGFLGIVNSLVTSIVERQREFSTLRAIGGGAGQVRAMVVWESMFLGILGGLLGLIGGLLLAVLLIEVINKQSFGWTIQFTLSGVTLVEAVGVALGAALAAGYFPARWATNRPIAQGLRYE
ncbi:MAG: FtsX-like permease family protein [Nitrospirota bacterium]|nr:FtsX-like permease family protein [Nitrospirota bacterium]